MGRHREYHKEGAAGENCCFISVAIDTCNGHSYDDMERYGGTAGCPCLGTQIVSLPKTAPFSELA